MSQRIQNDAFNIKSAIRETEALANELQFTMAKLKQSMLRARMNPDVEPHTGHRALMRLSEAERHAQSLSTNLLRTHDELTKVAEIQAGMDNGDIKTVPAAGQAVDHAPALELVS